MKTLLKSTLMIVLFALSSNTSAFAGGGIIDIKIANGQLNAAKTVWTFDIMMKQGVGFSNSWATIDYLVDIDYGTTGTLATPVITPTITSITQALVAGNAYNPGQASNIFPGSRAAGSENTIRINYANPITNPADANSYTPLSVEYKTYSTVTINFSAPLGDVPVFNVRTPATSASQLPIGGANTINQRSFWTDDQFDQYEFNSVNSSNTPLPINLLTFAATKAGTSRSLISWVTASEEAANYFEVERSTTGAASSFRSIGVRTPATNSKTEKEYQAYDENPVTGANYYRLKMVDLNGTVTYSSTRIVRFDSRVVMQSVSLFPNPIQVEGQIVNLKVDVQKAQTLQYSLVDVTGKLIYTGSLDVTAGSADYKLNGFESIASGSYFLNVKGETLSDNIKVLKVN